MEQSKGLVDQYGNPLRKEQLTKELAAPAVSSIRNPWGETVTSGLTPARLIAILRAAAQGDAEQFLTLAEEMEEKDLHYSSVLGTRKRAISGVSGVVMAASDETKDKQIADDVQALVDDPAFSIMRDELTDALGKGYAVCEIMWEKGKIWKPYGYHWRDPRHFIFDRQTGKKLLLRDEKAPEGLPLAPFKFVTHTPKLKCGLPIRGGLARLAAMAFICKSFTIKDWMGFLEVYGMPLRIGKYGKSASREDIDVLIKAVANIGTDAAAIMPESMQIEFVEAAKNSSQSGGAVTFMNTADWWDRQVSKAVLGQTASTEGTAGKLGSDDTQEEVRQDILKSDTKQLSDTINRDLIRAFVDLNFGVQERYPRYFLPVEDEEDIAALVTALKELVPLGLQVSEREVRSKLRLSEPVKDEPVLGAVLSEAKQESPPENNTVELNALSGREQADALDDIEQIALEGWQKQMQPLLDPLEKLVQRSGSYEDVLNGLVGLQEEMEPDEIIRGLAKAAFQARATGDSD